MTEPPTPASRGIDRRQVLKVGAWAAPAIVVAAAVPAAVASDYAGNVLAVPVPPYTVTNEDGGGQHILGETTIGYNPNEWNLPAGTAVPAQITASYRFQVFDSGNNFVAGSNDFVEVSIGANTSVGISLQTGALGAGPYTVVLTVTAVAADVGGNTFTPNTVSYSTPVTIS